jgi:hypothetical protein
MKTKQLFFLLCLGLGIILITTSCDKENVSYNCTDNIQQWLIEANDSIIKIFVKNEDKKCYNSLTQFAMPKYAKIKPQEIAYLLNNPYKTFDEDQVYTTYFFDGIFLNYTKIELNYTLVFQNGTLQAKENIKKNRTGICWTYIIGIGLTILGLFVYLMLHLWLLLIKKKKLFDGIKFLITFIFVTPTIIIVAIFVENFLSKNVFNFLLSIVIIIIFWILFHTLMVIETCFDEKHLERKVKQMDEKASKK